MKVELTKDWCMNMAQIEARAEELHEGCRMPMEQARELAAIEAKPAPNMTADDLMRLICRYTEACDDLGACLFEQTAAETDAKHGKAVFLHGQILAEVYRLHAEVAELDALRDRLADILSRTAVALRGPDPPLTRWGWHDLPERAAAAIAAIDLMQRTAQHLAADRAHDSDCATHNEPAYPVGPCDCGAGK